MATQRDLVEIEKQIQNAAKALHNLVANKLNLSIDEIEDLETALAAVRSLRRKVTAR